LSIRAVQFSGVCRQYDAVRAFIKFSPRPIDNVSKDPIQFLFQLFTTFTNCSKFLCNTSHKGSSGLIRRLCRISFHIPTHVRYYCFFITPMTNPHCTKESTAVSRDARLSCSWFWQ